MHLLIICLYSKVYSKLLNKISKMKNYNLDNYSIESEIILRELSKGIVLSGVCCLENNSFLLLSTQNSPNSQYLRFDSLIHEYFADGVPKLHYQFITYI